MTNIKIDTFQQQNFRMVFDRLPTVSYLTNEFNVPGISGGVATQGTPFNPVPLPGDGIQYEYFTLRFNLDEDWKNYIEIQNWLNQINFPQAFEQYRQLAEQDLRDMSDAELLVMNNANLPTRKITFKDAFPVSLSGFPLDAGAQGSAPLPVTGVFAYSFFEIS